MTKGTEQWSSELCRWIALQIYIPQSFWPPEGSTKYHNNLGKFTTIEPEGWKIRGGSGEPRICRSPGKTREFHDGAGLALRGRWDLERRTWNTDGFWKKLREGSLRLVLESCGGWQKFDL